MREFNQMLSAEIIAVTGGILAGGILAFYKGVITAVPGLLVFLPGFLQLRGALSGALSARVSTALHLGTVKHLKNSPIIRGNFTATVILTVIASVLLSFFAYFISSLLGYSDATIIFVGITAGIISGALMIPITFFLCFYVYKKGLDPDNVIGPYISTIGDVVCMASLILAVVIIA
ncbi:MAG: magnesium transporter [Candidatus Nanoarchaeia archaeon]|nr:magnesium transporter [Candidatus Nanoarchaeia archaeon]